MTDLLALAARLPRPTAYVLGGGGSWGALQWGMLRALAHTDVRPDLVVGTSVGSLNGAVVAADPDGAVLYLDALWPSVTREQVFPGGLVRSARTLHATKGWLFDAGPLTDFLTAALPAQRIEDLQVPFTAVATDFETGARAELDSGDLRSALLASSALPGIYPWVERDGRRLVDGGLVANVPTTVAVQRGARSLVVLDCGMLGVEERWSATIIDILVQSAAIASRQQVVGDLARCTDVPVVWLHGQDVNMSTQLDFGHTLELAAIAYERSLALLGELASTSSSAPALPPGLYGGPAYVRDDPRVASLLRAASSTGATR